jgi:hypothetical protein
MLLKQAVALEGRSRKLSLKVCDMRKKFLESPATRVGTGEGNILVDA